VKHVSPPDWVRGVTAPKSKKLEKKGQGTEENGRWWIDRLGSHQGTPTFHTAVKKKYKPLLQSDKSLISGRKDKPFSEAAQGIP